MSSTHSPAAAKKRRFGQYVQNLKDSYTISRRTFPWVGWALVGVLVVGLGLSVLLAILTSQSFIYWIIMGLMTALMLDLLLLSFLTRRASYTQIEGMPGAAKAILDQVGRGWYIESTPVAVNPSTQDVVWRMVGRPGVVLVVEGPKDRTRKMVAEETRTLQRILSTVPVHVINVGTQEGQTRLIDLQRTLRRLPTKPVKLTDAEISQVAKRLTSLSAKGLPIPKGIDPLRARPDRRAMRGH
ncbi:MULTISPECIES: DUF4191 family protein [Actinomyces]|uniref:DUF4191 family protein n=1 Tax=Actinomyces respiraculi TaxID=2744574 RepID=A0A7T0PWG4_9ACTO|nr:MULTISPECIES: DUF4191 family protein [Actinomyces]QPL06381.1 DUF4191 family protein [Actinomyces respiraculi]